MPTDHRRTVADAVDEIAKQENLDSEGRQAIRDALHDAALNGGVLLYPPGKPTPYDFSRITTFRAMPSLRLGSTDVHAVRTTVAEVYEDDLDAWLAKDLPRVKFRFDRSAESGAETSSSTSAPSTGTAQRWTDEALQLLVKRHIDFGTKATAEHYGISERRVRELVAPFREAKTPSPHIPFPAIGGRK